MSGPGAAEDGMMILSGRGSSIRERVAGRMVESPVLARIFDNDSFLTCEAC